MHAKISVARMLRCMPDSRHGAAPCRLSDAALRVPAFAPQNDPGARPHAGKLAPGHQ
jgi:hypothetical protein